MLCKYIIFFLLLNRYILNTLAKTNILLVHDVLTYSYKESYNKNIFLTNNHIDCLWNEEHNQILYIVYKRCSHVIRFSVWFFLLTKSYCANTKVQTNVSKSVDVLFSFESDDNHILRMVKEIKHCIKIEWKQNLLLLPVYYISPLR